MDFQSGDVVRLKSGGASMTVAHVEGRSVHCHWHDSEGRAQTASYALAMLVKSQNPETPPERNEEFYKPVEYPPYQPKE